MGAFKQLDIEMQELNVDCDITNSEDIFDLLVDMQLAGTKLSPLMLDAITEAMKADPSMVWLFASDEFAQAWSWHVG